MSKILDILNSHHKAGERPEHSEGNLSARPERRTDEFDISTREKLAHTYLTNHRDNEPFNSYYPESTRQKGLPSPIRAPLRKVTFVRIIPWLISFFAIGLLLLNMAYRGKVNIVVQFTPEAPSRQESFDAPPAPAVPAPETAEIPLHASSQSFTLVKDGLLNTTLIKNHGFYGAAVKESRITEDGFLLAGDGSLSWASMGIDFHAPMDFSSHTLDFFIKGSEGGESLAIIVRDAETRSYIPQVQQVILDRSIGEDWQFVSVPLYDLQGIYDSTKIIHIGFEFGEKTTDNSPASALRIKKIKITQNSTRD